MPSFELGYDLSSLMIFLVSVIKILSPSFSWASHLENILFDEVRVHLTPIQSRRNQTTIHQQPDVNDLEQNSYSLSLFLYEILLYDIET